MKSLRCKSLTNLEFGPFDIQKDMSPPSRSPLYDNIVAEMALMNEKISSKDLKVATIQSWYSSFMRALTFSDPLIQHYGIKLLKRVSMIDEVRSDERTELFRSALIFKDQELRNAGIEAFFLYYTGKDTHILLEIVSNLCIEDRVIDSLARSRLWMRMLPYESFITPSAIKIVADSKCEELKKEMSKILADMSKL